jgi:hypothetical protein
VAESPSHKFGQIVGQLLEEILDGELSKFCEARGLYLDRHGARKGVRKGKKVSWTDLYDNSHNLDFVIERDGSADHQGRPAAFIEAAWRRYTKHSRNKAQEIQGALLPIAETFADDAPFLGVVLAGEFTKGSLKQLKSHKFEIVHLSYNNVVEAFASVGIDTRFDQKTPQAAFRACVDQLEALSSSSRTIVREKIIEVGKADFDIFFESLRRKLDRRPKSVSVQPLFGNQSSFANAKAAQDFIRSFDTASITGDFTKFEVRVIFSDTDNVSGTFSTKEEALRFLAYVTS